MNNVHSEKFVDDIKNAKNHLELKGHNVGGEIVIDEFSGKSITLRGCVFENDVKFINVDLSCGIRLIDCTFRGNIEFDKVTISKIDFERKDGDVNDSLLLSNCKIEGQLAIHNNSEIIRNIHIKDDSEINKLYLRESRSQEGGIQISNTIINNVRSFSQCIFINDIRFDYCSFKGSIRFENNDTSDYSFMNSVFEKDVWIWAGIVKRGVIFNGGEFKDTFRIESIRTDEGSNLSLFNAKFHDTFTIDYEYYRDDLKIHDGPRSIWIKDSNFVNGITFNGNKKSAKPYRLKKIHVECSNKLIGEIEFNDFVIDKCLINGTLSQATMFFKNISVAKIEINKFFNKSTIQFVKLKGHKKTDENKREIEPELKILNSFLGTTRFDDVSFNNFNAQIVNSDLSMILTSNVKWFNPKKLNSGIEEESMPIEMQGFREIYKQLAYAMEQQGNRIQSLEFRRLEMSFYLCELKSTKGFWSQDRLIMELGRTNSHGSNWSKPFWILMGFTVLFSCVIILVASPALELKFASSWSDLSTTLDVITSNLSYFPKLLNPTTGLGAIVQPDEANGFWVNVLFIAYKVIYAFFIFQIIVAFRKYIRK